MRRKAAGAAPDTSRETVRRLFSAYFPRLFAYCLTATGDERAARDLVVEAFGQVTSRASVLGEDDTAVLLFGAARGLCRARQAARRRKREGLTAEEREVLSLVFDAQLCREQIACLLQLNPQDVAAVLARGLRKLRERPPARVAAATQAATAS